MMVFKKAKCLLDAKKIKSFIEQKGYSADYERNDGFMSDKYPFRVVGEDEEVLGLLERHDCIVNVVTGEVKREATWNKPESEWDEAPKRVRL